jgi:hypothetical protein
VEPLELCFLALAASLSNRVLEDEEGVEGRLAGEL